MHRALSLPVLALAAFCGAAAAVAFLPGVAESAAAAVGAVKTHFGTSANDIVVLQLAGPVGTRRFARVRSDGSLEQDWRVPTGAALFATDVEYASGWQNPAQGPYQRVLRLQIAHDTLPAQRATVMYAALLPSENLQTPTKLYTGGSARAQVGFTLGPGAHLEVDAPSTLDVDGNPQTGPFLGDVVVRGYLVRAK